MLKTLFDPRGTVDNKSYWRACEILFGLYLIAVPSWVFLAGRLKDHSGLDGIFLITGFVFFSYAYSCIYVKKLASAGLNRLWLMLVHPAFWGLCFSIGPFLLKNFARLGYDNVIWDAMIADTTPDALRVMSSTLYVLMMTSPSLVPIIICSLLVGMVKRPDWPHVPKPAVS